MINVGDQVKIMSNGTYDEFNQDIIHHYDLGTIVTVISSHKDVLDVIDELGLVQTVDIKQVTKL